MQEVEAALKAEIAKLIKDGVNDAELARVKAQVLAALIVFAIWAVVFKVSRYVSLASIVAAGALPVAVIGLMFFGPAQGWGAVHGWGNFYFAVAAAALVIKRHTANLQRLRAGTELRVGAPKTTGTQEEAK